MRYRKGQRVITTTNVDYAPHAIVPSGTFGIVVYVGEAQGDPAIEVQWEQYFPGLALWGNCTLLVEPEMSCVCLAVEQQAGVTAVVVCLVA